MLVFKERVGPMRGSVRRAASIVIVIAYIVHTSLNRSFACPFIRCPNLRGIFDISCDTMCYRRLTCDSDAGVTVQAAEVLRLCLDVESMEVNSQHTTNA